MRRVTELCRRPGQQCSRTDWRLDRAAAAVRCATPEQKLRHLARTRRDSDPTTGEHVAMYRWRQLPGSRARGIPNSAPKRNSSRMYASLIRSSIGPSISSHHDGGVDERLDPHERRHVRVVLRAPPATRRRAWKRAVDPRVNRVNATCRNARTSGRRSTSRTRCGTSLKPPTTSARVCECWIDRAYKRMRELRAAPPPRKSRDRRRVASPASAVRRCPRADDRGA